MSIRIGLSLFLLAALMCARAYAATGPFYINATEVNLRENPNGEIVLVFDLNDKVFVIEREGNWSYVSAPGREAKGWVWTEYIGANRVELTNPDAAVTLAANTQDECADGSAININLAPVVAPTIAETQHEASEPPGPRPSVCVDDVDVQAGQPVPVVETPLKQIPATSLDDVLEANTPAERPAPASTDVPVGADASKPELTVFTFEGSGSANSIAAQSASTTSALGDTKQDVQFASLQMPGTPVQVDVPELTDLGKCYKPVGGHDMALISGSDVNVREDSDLKSQVIGRVDKGDKVYILCVDDPWYYVSIPGRDLKGWVFGEYVSALSRVEITGDQVRLREEPSTDARIKDELFKGDVFFEFQRKGKWVLVASSASGMKGWVHGDYVKQTDRAASRPFKVTGDSINFRTSATVDSDIIAQLPQGTTVQVLGRNDKWSFIEYSGQQGWMYSQYLDPNFKGAPKAIYGKSIGERLIKRAKAMEGTPYVWGGESDGGVDCSGLIYKVLLEEGADASSLPRRASTQMAGLGQAVDKEDLIPGDLVFFTTYKAGASHVGIYLGDGDFIHASSAQSKVTISNMSEGYYKQRFVGARRITEDELRRMQ